MTNCRKCGKEIAKDTVICPGCGDNVVERNRQEEQLRMFGITYVTGAWRALGRTSIGEAVRILLLLGIGILIGRFSANLGKPAAPAIVAATPAPEVQPTPAPVEVRRAIPVAAQEGATPAPSPETTVDGVVVRKALPVTGALVVPGEGRLTVDEIMVWSETRVEEAINTIYARHGAEFLDANVQAWANSQPWYHRVPGATLEAASRFFTADDQYNMALLVTRREQLQRPQPSPTP